MDTTKNTQKNKISELIESSLGSIRELVDANTIVGEPIESVNGTMIIPISKVAVGFAGGGNDYVGKNASVNGKNNFGGGGGTGVSVTPVGFLVVRADGHVELLNINHPTEQSDLGTLFEIIAERAPELFAKLKSLFKKKDKSATEEAPEEDAAPASETTEETDA